MKLVQTIKKHMTKSLLLQQKQQKIARHKRQKIYELISWFHQLPQRILKLATCAKSNTISRLIHNTLTFFVYFADTFISCVFYQVFGLTDGCHMDIMIKVPVTIGTYPISDPLASHLRTLNRNEARVYTPSVVSHQPQSSGGRKPSAPYPEGGMYVVHNINCPFFIRFNFI